jgi:hypothetical protein
MGSSGLFPLTAGLSAVNLHNQRIFVNENSSIANKLILLAHSARGKVFQISI